MRRALLLPPDLHLSAGLVARDLLREAAAARLAEHATARQGAGETLLVDAGDRGATAAETAARVRAFGPGAVELFVPRTHRRAGRVLAAALHDAGLGVQEHPVDRPGPEPGGLVLPRAPDGAWTDRVEPGSELVLSSGPEPVPDAVASPFSPALHLGDDRWVELLTRRVAAAWPRAAAEWCTLARAHHARVSPLEAVYAGLHLRDRNAELLVNIL